MLTEEMTALLIAAVLMVMMWFCCREPVRSQRGQAPAPMGVAVCTEKLEEGER